MATIDFSKIEDPSNPTPVPPGIYPVIVAKVQYGTSRNDDDLIKLNLRITDGPNQGRTLLDNLVVNPVGLQRAKHVVQAMGFDVDGEVSLERDALLDRECQVRVEVEEYTNKAGEQRKRNKIPFIAYSAIDPHETGETPF